MDAAAGMGRDAEPVVLARPLPALGLPPEAVRSLRSAFAREVAIRLPRLLTAARETGEAGHVRADATMLAEGCTLLGDAAGARALHRLADVWNHVDPDVRLEAASTAALLLGRWAGTRPQT